VQIRNLDDEKSKSTVGLSLNGLINVAPYYLLATAFYFDINGGHFPSPSRMTINIAFLQIILIRCWSVSRSFKDE